jgi:hypothetical protein
VKTISLDNNSAVTLRCIRMICRSKLMSLEKFI